MQTRTKILNDIALISNVDDLIVIESKEMKSKTKKNKKKDTDTTNMDTQSENVQVYHSQNQPYNQIPKMKMKTK